MTQTKDDFWVGPYGIRISNKINWIVSADGMNTCFKEGVQTELHISNPMTKE